MNVEEITIVGAEIEIGTMIVSVIVNKTETMIGLTQETDAGHGLGPGPETDQGTMIATGIKTSHIPLSSSRTTKSLL